MWFECEKIISLTDRTVYKSTYPSALLTNFKSDTGYAQGLSENNVELYSDVAVYNMDTISSMKFGCFNEVIGIKAGSTIYLFGVWFYMAKIYENGIYREITNEDLPQMPENIEATPTVEERLFALESAVVDLAMQTMEVSNNDWVYQNTV